MPHSITSRKTRFASYNPTTITKSIPPITENLIQKNTRNVFHHTTKSNNNDLFQIIVNWTNSNDFDYYLGFGGTGDALVLLASCWNNPKAKVIFFANNESKTLTEKFFQLFSLQYYLHPNIMGQPIASKIYQYLKKHPKFKVSGHLADELNYGDWRNEAKYIPRIIKSVPWIDKLGKVASNATIIAPSGSIKEVSRQRYLQNGELTKLITKFNNVYLTGSDNDYNYYKLSIGNHLWLTTDNMKGKNTIENIDLRKMLQIINGCKQVYSMDSFLKTYSLLVGLPTTVISTRWHGKYKNYGEDTTDWIFLNKNIWKNIKITTIEEILTQI